MFYAVYMPGAEWAKFDTYEKASDFIESMYCPMCVHDARVRPHDPHGGCDAEWSIWTQEDWDEFGPIEPEHEISNMTKLRGFGFEFSLLGFTFVFWRAAGVFCVYRKKSDWCLHFLLRRRFWFWGIDREWETWVGAGPFFLFIAEW